MGSRAAHDQGSCLTRSIMEATATHLSSQPPCASRKASVAGELFPFPRGSNGGSRDMKLSEVTRPVRSKAPDLRLSVHKATVSRRRRAESGQGQPRNKTTKMETRGLWERTVVSWTGANGVSRGGGTRLQPPPAPPAGSWLPFPVCKQQRRPGRGQRSLPALPFYLPGFLVLKPQAGIAAMPSVWQVRVCSLNTASKVPWAPTPGHPARQGRTEVRAANTDVFSG